jgi:hypothetical protein
MVLHNEERPGSHPEPPDDLAKRDLPLINESGPWWRIHSVHRTPLHFGKSRLNRFDDPDGKIGVLYLGADAHCALIETLGWATGVNVVYTSDLARRVFATVRASRELRLVNLTGAGLAQLGADNRLTTGDHACAQRWSSMLYSHPEGPDGILYRARHDPSRTAIAVFDRAQDALHCTVLGALSDQANIELLRTILDEYRFGVIDG